MGHADDTRPSSDSSQTRLPDIYDYRKVGAPFGCPTEEHWPANTVLISVCTHCSFNLTNLANKKCTIARGRRI